MAVRRLRDAWVLAALTFLLAASYTAFFGWNRLHVDATAYWEAGTRLRTGLPLYATTAVAALDKAYLYPPAFAAAFAPLTALPPLWGYAVWMALEVLFTVALARTCATLAGLGSHDGRGAHDDEARRTALALALAAGLVPIFDNLAEGQVNLLVALLCAVALREAERGRTVRAAFALAGAVHIKLVPIVLAGAFAVWRRPRLLAWTAVALVAVGALPLVWRVGTLGVGAGLAACADDYTGFWHAILWPAASANEVAGVPQLFAPNFSFRGTLSRLFVADTALSPFPADAARRGPLLFALPSPLVNAASSALGLAALGAALWACRRSADDGARRIAAAGLLLAAGGLAGPSFWQHHFVALGLAGAGLWAVLASRSRRAQRIAWTCALGPLVVTMTLPFFVALVSHDFETGPYRDLRELGAATAAVLAFFVTGLVVVTQRTPTRS
jgi:hypothetical protein